MNSASPRSAGDVQLGAAAAGSSGSGGPSSGASTGTSAGSGASSGDPSGADPAASATAPDVDLDSLAGSVARRVRVGGLVVDLGPERFRIDDGTAIGTVVLTGPALDLLSLIEPGDAIQATGTVARTDQGFVVTISDPAALTKAGDPVPQDASSPAAGTPASPATAIGTHDLAGFGLLAVWWVMLPFWATNREGIERTRLVTGAGVLLVAYLATFSLLGYWK